MPGLDQKSLSERDICTKFITPALEQAGWDVLSQIREEACFTKDRIIVRGKLVTRGKAKRADYILYYKPNIPIALIQAKDNSYLEKASKQTTNLASINMTQLRSCPLPLSPLAEQDRIVAKVEELMALRDRLEAQLTTTQTESRRLLEAVLARVFTGDETWRSAPIIDQTLAVN